MSNELLTIAVSKGRIFKEALPLLEHAGVVPLEDPESSRKLILETNRPDVRLVIIRATDVPPYVEYGGADLGIAGKDVLMEYEGEGLYEPVDLRIAQCQLMVAGKPEQEVKRGRLRVATKYVKAAKKHFAAKGQQVE
ncbi:MAG: ATP phosphoribosyltransferase, partial [Gammaproteobacteria bacterium]